jgi:hypothetical protein
MSTMEPDEGTDPGGQRSDAPSFDKLEAASAPDERRWPEADTDAESSDTDGSDADEVSSSGS